MNIDAGSFAPAPGFSPLDRLPDALSPRRDPKHARSNDYCKHSQRAPKRRMSPMASGSNPDLQEIVSYINSGINEKDTQVVDSNDGELVVWPQEIKRRRLCHRNTHSKADTTPLHHARYYHIPVARKLA